MQKIMFDGQFGLQQATFDGIKDMTRRIALTDPVENMNVGYDTATHQCLICSGERIVARSRYAVGEIVAIAQGYIDVYSPTDFASMEHAQSVMNSPGWLNKMYVRADVMPHHIKITGIKVESLCGISDEDCLKEGIYLRNDVITSQMEEVTRFQYHGTPHLFKTPYRAYKDLIDRLNKRGYFESNPLVYAYTYELVD